MAAGAIEAGPQWFGAPTSPLFGWVHDPAGSGPAGSEPTGQKPPGAVVLCRPLFGEDTVADAAYRRLARALSAAGLWVVRFDYAGTGDSSGTVGDGLGVAAWLDSVDRAVDLARARTTGPVALCGLRMGALLAAAAAERRGDLDAVALWDPCRSGRTFLRRQQALQAARFSGLRTDGVVEVPGYVLDGELAEELAALSLPSALPVRRALLLVRPGDPADLAVAVPGPTRPTGSTGPTVPADVDRTLPGEQEALLEVDPLTSRQPEAAVARVADWLARTMGALAATDPIAAAGPTRPVVARPGAAGVVLDVPGGEHGTRVAERVVRLGELGLFGIETEPASGPRVAGKVAVFLSSGMDRHTGPSRLWVTLARRWAAEGVRCLRMDLTALGESPGRPGQAEEVMRAPEAFDDVRQVVEGVAGGAGDVVLVGLCSGGYQALESTLALSPSGVLAVNPLLRFTPPELAAGGALDSRRRICVPKRPWVGTVRARVPRPVAEWLAGMRARWPRGRQSRNGDDWMAELVRAGVHVYCICGEQEAQLLRPAEAAAVPPWGPSEQPRIEIVRLDHALLPAAQRDLVCDRLTEELHRMPVRRSPAAAGRVG